MTTFTPDPRLKAIQLAAFLEVQGVPVSWWSNKNQTHQGCYGIQLPNDAWLVLTPAFERHAHNWIQVIKGDCVARE